MTSISDLGIPRHELWGITRFRTGDDLVIRPVLWSEMARDTAWARGLLEETRIGRGAIAMTTANFSESAAIRAIETAAMELGGTICPTDAWSFDAPRIAMYVKQLDIAVAIGIGREVVDGLRSAGQDLAVLSRVTTLFARPDAIGELRQAGVEPSLVVMSGPLIALECAYRTGAHVDAAEWQLDEGPAGQIVMSSLEERGLPVGDLPLDADLELLDGTCPCGRSGPRLGLR